MIYLVTVDGALVYERTNRTYVFQATMTTAFFRYDIDTGSWFTEYAGKYRKGGSLAAATDSEQETSNLNHHRTLVG
jgi:hypothetical protein